VGAALLAGSNLYPNVKKVCPNCVQTPISNKTKKEYKYLLDTLAFSFKTIILATKIMNNGLTNSIG